MSYDCGKNAVSRENDKDVGLKKRVRKGWKRAVRSGEEGGRVEALGGGIS